MDFLHLNQPRVWAGAFQKVWKKSLQLVSFAYSVSFLDPESCVREELQSTVGAARDRTVVCGVPTSLSSWGRRAARPGVPTGAPPSESLQCPPQSPPGRVCAAAPCPTSSPTVQTSPCGPEAPHPRPERVLWICTGRFLGSAAESGPGPGTAPAAGTGAALGWRTCSRGWM